MSIKKNDLECCICLESYSDNNNILEELPCSCNLWIHQKCFIKTNFKKCLICKQRYKLDNFSDTLKLYLIENNLMPEFNSVSETNLNELSDEEIDAINDLQLDILEEDTTNLDNDPYCKNLLLSLLTRIVIIYILGLFFGLIYCVMNKYTYPQLVWYLHILVNLITGSVIFLTLYFCCNQIRNNLRNS